MVKSYSDLELLNKVKSLSSFEKIPDNFWLLGIQSNEDLFDRYDDKFYLYYNDIFILTVNGTTNSGSTGIKNKLKDVAIIKTNEWYYDLWKYGLHKNINPALVQIKPIKFYRDGNRNNSIEEIGTLFEEIIGINFHSNNKSKNNLIKGWSRGCQVITDNSIYNTIINLSKTQDKVSYCLIKEF